MQGVQAFDLKSAVAVAVEKQINAGKLLRTASPGDVMVQFSGKTAWTQWKIHENYYGTLGGKSATFNRVTATINYPEIADNAFLTRGEADRVAAYSLHELGHVMFTDMSVKATNDFHFEIMNGLEDARIERKMIDERIAPGAGALFSQLANSIMYGLWNQGYNPNDPRAVPVTLAMLGRNQGGTAIQDVQKVWDMMSPEIGEMYTAALDRLKDAKSTQDCKIIADWVFGYLKQMQQAEQQDSQGQSKSGESGKAGLGSGKPESSELETGDEPGDRNGDSADQENSGWNEGKGDNDPSEANGPNGDDSGAGEQSGSKSDESGDADASIGGKGEQSDGQSNSQSNGGSYSPTGSAVEELDISKINLDKLADFIASDAAQNMNELARGVKKRVKDAEQAPPSMPVKVDDAEKWVRDRNRSLGNASAMTAVYNDIKSRVGVKSAALQSQFARLLVSPERAGWDRQQPAGRFDMKSVNKMMAGYENVYSRRWELPGTETAVTILVDGSSSMSGSNMSAATDLSVLLCTIMERCRAQVEVCVFQNDGESLTEMTLKEGERKFLRPSESDKELLEHSKMSARYGSHRDYRKTSEMLGGAMAWFINNGTGGMAKLIMVKSMDQKMDKRAAVFGAMPYMASGGTPDYAGLRACIDRMMQRKQYKRRVIFLLTDGEGASEKLMQQLDKLARDREIDIVAVGIGTRGIEAKYKLAINVQGVQDLGSKSLSMLIRNFEQLRGRSIGT